MNDTLKLWIPLVAALALGCAGSEDDAGTPDAGAPDGGAVDVQDLLDTSSPQALYESIAPAFEAVEPDRRQALATAVYESAEAAAWIPIVFDTTVVFLYRHEEDATVQVRGDMNAWGNAPPQIPLTRVEGTDLYLGTYEAPSRTARLDYKLVVDGAWILDPGNPREAWGGFGPNSEFAMPDYEYSPWVVERTGIEKGTLSDNLLLSSTHLGYDVQYRVYTPAGYEAGQAYPLLVTTDGHEYADPKLGAVPVVADNLIADGLVEPVVIVFVDPREPGNLGNNRRQDQYVTNPEFADFLALELVPAVRAAYAVATSPDRTAILGTSLGGVNSAWLGLTHAEVFGLIAIQSPAFQARRAGGQTVLQLYEAAERAAIQKIWMDAGTVYDTHQLARSFQGVLEAKGYPAPSYHEFDEGHSWGSWRARIDDILRYFYPR